MKVLMIVAWSRYENLSPLLPGALSRKAGGEGGDIRVTSHLLETSILSSRQYFHQANSESGDH